MKKRERGRAGDRGTVFLSTMVSTLLMVMVAGYIYRLASYDLHYVSQLKKSAQAQQLADAGLAKALSTLASDFTAKDDPASFPVTDLENGNYDVTITQSSGRVLVSSVGVIGDTQRTATAEVSGPPPSAMDYSLAGNSIAFTLVGQSSVTATGDIYSNTTISLNAQAGSSSVNLTNPGDADAGGTITTSGSGTISMGQSNPGSSLATFPTVNFSYYQDIAQNQNGYYYNGNKNYNSTNSMPSPSGGVIFINGDLTISKTQTTTAAIVVTGNVNLTGGTLSVDPQNNAYPALITQNGSITLSGTGNSDPSVLTAVGLVYSGNNFTISGNHHTINVTGSILAKGSLTGNYSGWAHNVLGVTYSSANLTAFTTPSSADFEVVSYNR